jgi:DNA-binding MarR family transcriptional regulator
VAFSASLGTVSLVVSGASGRPSVGSRVDCYDRSAQPNFAGVPNISPAPTEASVDRVVTAYERFHAWITKLHVPHFLELNLTLAQLKTLYLVSASEPLRMSEVADRLGTAPSTTSGVVDGLVHLDMLERVADPSDRRQVLVRPTAAAQRTLEDFHDMSRTRLRELLGHITDEEDLAAIEHAIDLLADAAGSTAEDLEHR